MGYRFPAIWFEPSREPVAADDSGKRGFLRAGFTWLRALAPSPGGDAKTPWLFQGVLKNGSICSAKPRCCQKGLLDESGFVLGLGQADGALSFFPLATLLEDLDAFETLENRALAAYCTGCFETGMLRHNL